MNRRKFVLSFLTSLLVTVKTRAGVIFHEETPTATTKEDLPELWYWSHEGCPPCARFVEDYEKHKVTCGFRAVKQEGQRPTWMPDSDPQFWWATQDKSPSQNNVLNTRHQDGYRGWEKLLESFNKSRNLQKAVQGRRPASIPFVQPDQQGTRAVARSPVYSPGHNCPNCGRSQFHIENDAGPNHTHRCGSCNTVWYHADQSRSFLSWF